MTTPVLQPEDDIGVMMCPQGHKIRRYTPDYRWLDDLKRQAVAQAQAQSTEINLSAVNSAVSSDICCDVCFQADNSRHRDFYRCPENCNYDL
jgi:hypothetical protein